MIDWLFRSRESGDIVVGQRPNLAMHVFNGATVASWIFPRPAWRRTAHDTATASLATWAASELVRGVNPFRRMLGLGGLLLVLRRIRS